MREGRRERRGQTPARDSETETTDSFNDWKVRVWGTKEELKA